jgi:hypothetical protein
VVAFGGKMLFEADLLMKGVCVCVRERERVCVCVCILFVADLLMRCVCVCVRVCLYACVIEHNFSVCVLSRTHSMYITRSAVVDNNFLFF